MGTVCCSDCGIVTGICNCCRHTGKMAQWRNPTPRVSSSSVRHRSTPSTHHLLPKCNHSRSELEWASEMRCPAVWPSGLSQPHEVRLAKDVAHVQRCREEQQHPSNDGQNKARTVLKTVRLQGCVHKEGQEREHRCERSNTETATQPDSDPRVRRNQQSRGVRRRTGGDDSNGGQQYRAHCSHPAAECDHEGEEAETGGQDGTDYERPNRLAGKATRSSSGISTRRPTTCGILRPLPAACRWRSSLPMVHQHQSAEANTRSRAAGKQCYDADEGWRGTQTNMAACY